MRASEARQIARAVKERQEEESLHDKSLMAQAAQSPEFKRLLDKIGQAARRGEPGIITYVDDGIIPDERRPENPISLQRAQLRLLFEMGYKVQDLHIGNYRIAWSL